LSNLFEKSYLTTKNWLNQALWTFNDSIITPLSLIRFALLICVVLWLSRFVLRAMNQLAEKRGAPQRYMIYRLARLTYYIVLALGLLFAISSIGIDFTQLTLIASALGVGLGFGLQTIFNNFFSGIILLFEDQLKLGDWIEIEGGIKGEIREINFRTSTLRTQEGTLVFVPNSSLINSRVSLIKGSDYPSG
jgi:small-conductance mechanosensitive channel